MAALNVDYIAWITTVLGAINSNLTFIFDLNYFLWKLKTSKRQGLSSLLETKHKIFQFKTKKIPRITSVQDAKSSLKILVANAQLSVALATGWSYFWSSEKYGGVFVFNFWGLRGLSGLRGLCFQDTLFFFLFCFVSVC